jgi:TRAP-type C4-dicarboxylate transport system substrate-binding protein
MRRIFRHSVDWLFVALVILIAGGARDAAAQEIKLKLSHFAPTAHNHHANVIVPWAE